MQKNLITKTNRGDTGVINYWDSRTGLGGGGDFLVFLNAKSKEKLKKLFWL